MVERYVPAESMLITAEGAQAGVEKLKREVLVNEKITFVHKLKEFYPDCSIYLVGGIVRDAVMGIKSSDYDVLIVGLTSEQLRDFLNQNGKVVVETDTQTAVYKFLPQGQDEVIDVAMAREESYDDESRKPTVKTDDVKVEDDLKRRDFTINAMALDLFSDKESLVDPYGGVEDIQNKIIRAVGEPKERFLEDPLRMLRAVRFACRFGFEIDEKTMNAIVELVSELSKKYETEEGKIKKRVSGERVRKEFVGALTADPVRFLELYDQSHILIQILPEVADLHGVEQPEQYHSEGDVFEHTKLVLKNLPQDAGLETMIAALLHDIGKKETFVSAQESGDRIRFNGHDELSASKTREILERLRFNRDFIERVVWIVKSHMTILNFQRMRTSKRKNMARHEAFSSLVALAEADARSSLRPDGSVDVEFMKSVRQTLVELEKEKKEDKPLRIIDGNQMLSIIADSDLEFDHNKDGRVMGMVLNRVNESYQNGDIEDFNQAKNLSLKLLSENLDKK